MKNRKKRFISLRFRWSFFICLGILLSLVVTIISINLTTSRIIQSDDQDTNQVIAQQVAEQVSINFGSFESSIDQLASIVASEVQEVNALEMIQKNIQAAQEANDQILAAYYMDFQTGKLYISPYAETNLDVRDTESYKTLSANPKTQWMDIYQDKITGDMMTSVLSPILLNGELIGAVGYDINLSTIGNTRKQIEELSTQKIIILDAKGVVVSSFMKNTDGQNMKPSNSGKVDGVTDIDDSASFADTYAWVEKIYSHETVTDDTTLNGTSYQFNSTTIPTLNWKVVSFQPENVYQEKMADIQKSGLVSAFFGLLIGIICAWIIAHSITKLIKQFQQTIKKTATGDFSSEFNVRSNDEMGQLAESFNQMLASLRTFIGQVRQNTEQVAASSNGVSASAQENTAALNQVAHTIADVTDKIETQEKNTEESVRAIGEITLGTVRIAENAANVAQSSVDVTKQAQLGQNYIQKVGDQMNSIKLANSQTNEVIHQLEMRSSQIGKILEVITEIANQTNLLSLNAAIEAARAGENGKGFAVVADEVRKLAEESRTSASQIAEIIEAIQTDTARVREMMDNGDQEVASGLAVAKETSHLFEEIKQSIEKVNGEVHELSAIAEELSASTLQVNASVEEVSILARATSSGAEEIAAATEEQLASIEEVTASATELANMSEQLKQAISKFKL